MQHKLVRVFHLQGWGRLQRDVKKMYYTINGGARAYASGIKSATHNWVWTGYDHPIYLNLVTSTSAIDLDFYASYKNNGVIGRTLFFNANGSKISPTSNNWYYTKVEMNTKYANRSFFNGTIRHEIGHALGLAHTSNRYSIMCQTAYRRAVQYVTKMDSDMIVNIYGWR
ncbi:MAG: matrixin family metalloprotease [Breznakia sp.]